jgi:hypothetical protein
MNKPHRHALVVVPVRAAALALVVGLAIFGAPSRASASTLVVCTNNTAHDTLTLQAAINAGGIVALAPGTCALSNHMAVAKPTTITGAGPAATFLVQHADINIFQITAPGVTVENMNLDTRTYNTASPSPQPSVLFSAKSNTSVVNVTAEAGNGFGMRISGPSPCTTFQTTGTVVQNLNITSTGTGGFASLDIDCTNGATLSNITIHGNYVALYQDENSRLTSEAYTPAAKPCQFAVYITGYAANVAVNGVTGGGGVKQAGAPLVAITVANVTKAPLC